MKRELGRYIPLIFSLILIFGLTFQNCGQSSDLTVWVQKAIAWIAHTSQNRNWWDNTGLIRRLAHTFEYFLLGLGAMYVLRQRCEAGILSVAVSFIDEVIKGFLPGREFSFVDMGFDFIGYTLGIVSVVLIEIAVSRFRGMRNRNEQ